MAAGSRFGGAVGRLGCGEECFRLVAILVSHLSAENAERWGTRCLALVENARFLDCARDDRVVVGLIRYWLLAFDG